MGFRCKASTALFVAAFVEVCVGHGSLQSAYALQQISGCPCTGVACIPHGQGGRALECNDNDISRDDDWRSVRRDVTRKLVKYPKHDDTI